MLQRDAFTSYLFIICLDYVLRTSLDTMKDNGFKLTGWSRRYHAETIMDADNADYIGLLVNTPAQANTLQHSLERAAAGIGIHVKADISTLNGSSLKIVDKFTYQGSSVSSPETDINTQLAKAWVVNDRLSVIWKSD